MNPENRLKDLETIYSVLHDRDEKEECFKINLEIIEEFKQSENLKKDIETFIRRYTPMMALRKKPSTKDTLKYVMCLDLKYGGKKHE